MLISVLGFLNQKTGKLFDRLFNFFSKHYLFTLIGIFFMGAITILTNSFLNENGYLSGDSYHYLRVAQKLVKSKFLFSQEALHIKTALWPLGYPFFIALVGFMTNLKVFWASKVLNILLLGGSLIILLKFFRQYAWVYGLIFLSASFLEYFSYTFSEAGFIFGLTWFIFSLSKFLNKCFPTLWQLLSIVLSILFLFLFRYIGIFTILLLGIICLKEYWQGGRNFKPLVISIFVSLPLIGAYLLLNLKMKGQVFGERDLAVVNSGEFFLGFFYHIFLELIIPINQNFHSFKWIISCIGLQGLFLMLNWFHEKPEFKNDSEDISHNSFWKISLLGGLTYLVIVFLVIFILMHDFPNARYLIPASFLLFLGLLKYSEVNHFPLFKILGKTSMVIFLFSFMLNTPIKFIYQKAIIGEPLRTYTQHMNDLRTRYKNMERPAIIGFGSYHLDYRESDLTKITPPICRTGKVNYSCTMDSFKNVLKKRSEKAYVEIRDSNYLANDNTTDYHKSIYKFMNKHKGKDWVLIE